MKQAELPPNAKWTGPSHAGVKAPDPILLPDRLRRFGVTAGRLENLAGGHPLEAWLRFLASLSWSQHAVATTLAPSGTPGAEVVARAVGARLPPLAADGHPRDPAWREGLRLMLAEIESAELPPPAVEAIEQLRDMDDDAIERLADQFLRGAVPATEAAAAVYIAAALQVYFTVSASRLVVTELRLLEERSLCPCCGSPSVVGLITASGITPGTRFLQCSLCSSAWNHVRASCITCGGTGKLQVQAIEGDNGLVKVETCGDCHTYSKLLYQVKDMQVDPVADDLASLGLDLLVAEAGFSRHAPNPFLLMGDTAETD
ncbi:MAG TPA: formate dehydrogenase accessory protein FdhE [Luteibacter sp.]|uniref:formate dehydrogenase accessory protein FdhE n=1 Tax=Luteibacter sp. TaxID=1886636 RepID=UPI002F3E84D9